MEIKYTDIVLAHYKNQWGSDFETKRYMKGPMFSLSKDFFILEYKPTDKRKMWTYATCGMSSFHNYNPIELHLFSSKQDKDNRVLEILTALSYYHKKESNINLNHTVNFGIPWQNNSRCTYGFISLPYLDGPSLEVFDNGHGRIIHFYWLIPVTKEEVNYMKITNVEALELLFDQAKFDYLDPNRKSLI